MATNGTTERVVFNHGRPRWLIPDGSRQLQQLETPCWAGTGGAIS